MSQQGSEPRCRAPPSDRIAFSCETQIVSFTYAAASRRANFIILFQVFSFVPPIGNPTTKRNVTMSVPTCVFLIVAIFVSLSSQQQMPNMSHFLPIPVENATNSTVVVEQENKTENLPMPAPPPSPPPLPKDASLELKNPAHLGPIEVLNQKSIRIEGFHHVQRRTAVEVMEDVAQIEELLPLDQPKNIPAFEIFERYNPELEVNSSGSGSGSGSGNSIGSGSGSGSGSGDNEDVSASLLVSVNGSSIQLIPGPGLLHSVQTSHLENEVLDVLKVSHDLSELDDNDFNRHFTTGEPIIEDETPTTEPMSKRSNEAVTSLAERASQFVKDRAGLIVKKVSTILLGKPVQEKSGEHSFKRRGTSRPYADEDWWNSLSTLLPRYQERAELREDVAEGSAVEQTDADQDNETIETDEVVPRYHSELDEDFITHFTTMKPAIKDGVSAVGPISKRQSATHQDQTISQSNLNGVGVNSTINNSTKWRYNGPIATLFLANGRVAEFMKEHAGVIIGIVIAIPMMLILLYFIHQSRRRGYTGSLNVSPTSLHAMKKRSSMYRSAVTFCSQENELSMAPSTSSPPPKPPPLPMK